MKQLNIIVFLLLTIFSFAQTEIKSSVNIKQDGISSKFYLLEQDERGVRSYDPDKYYYWFKAQKIMSTQGGSSGSLLNGVYESFYSNNQLFESGTFNKGLKDGEWKKWSASGQLIRIENWNKGSLQRKQIDYNQEGKITCVTQIRGTKTVLQKQDTLIEIRGKRNTTTVFDTLGKKVSVSRFCSGQLDGKQETWDSSGEKVVVNYKKGEVVEAKPKKDKKTKTSEDDSSEKKTPFYKKWFKKKDVDAETNNPKEKKTKKPLIRLKKKNDG